ncbi:hypothetical protein [Saccharothrix sp. S26]|nr:hypothetical protein [Saccharothrix sp. S26]
MDGPIAPSRARNGAAAERSGRHPKNPDTTGWHRYSGTSRW